MPEIDPPVTNQAEPSTSTRTDFRAGRVATVCIAHGVHDTYSAFLPSLLPVFIGAFALSNTKAGLLTVFLQAPSLLQPFIGNLADRVSLRYMVILCHFVSLKPGVHPTSIRSGQS